LIFEGTIQRLQFGKDMKRGPQLNTVKEYKKPINKI
jgi:hypothetical protein